MNSGNLNDRVIVQQVAITADGFGGIVETWTTLGTVWADVRAPRGAERAITAAAQELATVDYIVRCRYLPGLSPANHRIIHDGRTLDILSVVDPTGRRATMHLSCRAIEPEGTIAT